MDTRENWNDQCMNTRHRWAPSPTSFRMGSDKKGDTSYHRTRDIGVMDTRTGVVGKTWNAGREEIPTKMGFRGDEWARFICRDSFERAIDCISGLRDC
ncbi:hypothetical protein CEXT_700691 [Caerostris extrusa]|uniref:Uncharacterized protein n=1 Tax=Caerostris extrusa TaxID=172846 RepID=A0AAV4PX73_CAEEX|nr:hypothetical protein CEXT_700691 [Caerostris extrusa]